MTKVFFAFDHLKPYASRLQGETVCQVTVRGKAILTRFSNGQTLYTHNQLYGRWLIITGGEYPDSSRQLRLAIHTGDHAALLYSASDISILNAAELRQHPYVSRLGPDLLDPVVDAEHLAAKGFKIGRNCTRRLMKVLNIKIKQKCKYQLPVTEDVLNRQLSPQAPYQAWGTDITY